MKDQKHEMLEITEGAVLRAEAQGFDATADVFRSIRDQLIREFKARGQIVGMRSTETCRVKISTEQ